MIAVTATKITNHRVNVAGGYQLVSGWALARADGALYTSNGTTPYTPMGGRNAAMAVAETGLLVGARFMRVN